MKSTWVVRFFLAVTLTVVWSGRSLAFEIVRDGAPVSSIYVDQTELAGPGGSDLKIATEELQLHLRKMSSAALAVVAVKDSREVAEPAIILGKLCEKFAASPIAITSQNHEGYRLECGDKAILIWGESPKGTLNGVYDLLERLGCGWVMPGDAGMITPQRLTIDLDSFSAEVAPSFNVRGLWFSGGKAALTDSERETIEIWLRRMRLTPSSEISGADDLMLRGGHFWSKLIDEYKSLFAAHPEWLALARKPDGALVRSGPQLETSNPQVVDLFVRSIENQFSENHWPADKRVDLSISPSDGLGFSESMENKQEGSERLDPFYGERERTDDIVLLANRIFQRLGNRYPNLYLGEYLYGVHSNFPSRYTPNPHFVNIAADITFSRFHSTVDDSSPSRYFYRHVLDQWAQLAAAQGNPIYFRGYNWNLAEATLPYTKVKIWGEDIPYYYAHHFLALDVEAMATWATTGVSDFVFAKMAWNPAGDWKTYLEEYCRLSFGKAAAPMMDQIYLAQIERQHGSANEAGGFNAFSLIYDLKFTETILDQFGRAEAAATGQSQSLIRWQRYPWDQLKRYLEMKRAEAKLDYISASRYYDEMLAAYHSLSAEDSLLVGRGALRYLGRFLEAPIKKGLECTTGSAQVIAQIPELLPVRLDPFDRGEDMGFFLPPREADSLTRIHTYASTWDAQGLAPLRKGSVWYYAHVTIPSTKPGRKIGLFLGNLENESRVWINGRKAGSSRGFGIPHIYDVTELVRTGANDITIAVRRAEIQEIGVGGLMAPAFVFSSDHVDSTGDQEKGQRALPGGEYEKTSPSKK